MKVIPIELSDELSGIEIRPIADWHYSDPNSDHEKIMEDIAYIRDRDNVYTVLHGDILDCAIASSVGDTYGATLSPMEELRACVEIFEPLAKDGKILCVLKGNHEARHYRTNGIDLTELMCRQLGIEDRYSPTTALLIIRLGRSNGKTHFRKIPYTVYVSHGNGGGRKEGGKLQRLVDLSTIVDADIYICGHTHLPAAAKDRYIRPTITNNSVAYCTRLYVNTSAKLNYGGYGEVGGYKPSSLDTPTIYLSGERKEFSARI